MAPVLLYIPVSTQHRAEISVHRAKGVQKPLVFHALYITSRWFLSVFFAPVWSCLVKTVDFTAALFHAGLHILWVCHLIIFPYGHCSAGDLHPSMPQGHGWVKQGGKERDSEGCREGGRRQAKGNVYLCWEWAIQEQFQMCLERQFRQYNISQYCTSSMSWYLPHMCMQSSDSNQQPKYPNNPRISKDKTTEWATP